MLYYIILGYANQGLRSRKSKYKSIRERLEKSFKCKKSNRERSLDRELGKVNDDCSYRRSDEGFERGRSPQVKSKGEAEVGTNSFKKKSDTRVIWFRSTSKLK